MKTRLGIPAILRDPALQIRAELSSEAIADYRDALAAGADLPPVTVFQSPDDGLCRLVDGWHRLAAAEQNGATDIIVDLRRGTKREALLAAIGANASHGLRRTNADKRRAVLALLGDKEWAAKSDRWIAKQANVSARLVAELRSGAGIRTSVARGGADGKSYPVPEPRMRAARPATDDGPDEWLRDKAVAEIPSELDASVRRLGEMFSKIDRSANYLSALVSEFRRVLQGLPEGPIVGIGAWSVVQRVELLGAQLSAFAASLRSRGKETENERDTVA